MQRVEEPMETIHLYVVREKEKRPYSLLPLFFAFLCLVFLAALTLYSGEHPLYEQETIKVPAILLPIQNYGISVPVIPTGSKRMEATTAHGLLTVYNGSIFTQDIPKGLILIANNGVEVVTDTDISVPAGSFNGYGFATVLAHAMVAGKSGNIPADALDLVEGSSVYIRNLTVFYGGKDAYSVKVITTADQALTLSKARQTLKQYTLKGLLLYPCKETSRELDAKLTVTWACQFFTYHFPPNIKVTRVRVVGKTVIVDGMIPVRPRRTNFSWKF